MPETATKYSRVMLKISGEALMGDQGYGLHPPTVERIAREMAVAAGFCMRYAKLRAALAQHVEARAVVDLTIAQQHRGDARFALGVVHRADPVQIERDVAALRDQALIQLDEKAKVGLLCWGTTAGPCRGAVFLAEQESLPLAMLQVQMLSPLPVANAATAGTAQTGGLAVACRLFPDYDITPTLDLLDAERSTLLAALTFAAAFAI